MGEQIINKPYLMIKCSNISSLKKTIMIIPLDFAHIIYEMSDSTKQQHLISL
jgi:hypothetical protein